MFSINGTDFGIDQIESIARLTTQSDGSRVLTLDVRGDTEIYRSQADGEDSKWSWTLYPPRFYLLDYVLPVGVTSVDAEVRLTSDDFEDYDLALYMMEHNEVSNFLIRLHGDSELIVSGSVDLMGEVATFEIRCALEVSSECSS